MTEKEIVGCSLALLRSIHFSGVKFVRFFALDACGNVRCKARPVDTLLSQGTLDDQVSIATICYSGLLFYADVMIDGTGLSAKHVLKVQPDLSSFGFPYAPKTAVAMGNAHDQLSGEPSPFCARGLLQRVIQLASEEQNTAFSVGAENEFLLVDSKTEIPIDHSVFANSVTLNDQEPYLSTCTTTA